MRLTAALTAIIILALTIPWSPVQAMTEPGQYRVTLGKDHIAVSLTATLDQNLTTTIPQFSFILQEANSSSVYTAITNSIRQKTPDATLTDFLLAANSNGTHVRVSISFNLNGPVSSDQWGNARANLVWRSFKVEDDLQVNGVAFNLVGKNYLSASLQAYVDTFFSGIPAQFRPAFKLDGERATPLEIRVLAPTLNLLDFSSLSTSLDTWSNQFNLSPPSTTWTQRAGFDVEVQTPDPEAGPGEAFFTEKAYYKVDAVLEVPGAARADGDTILYGEGILEQIMAAAIAAVLLIAVGTYLADRRLSRRQRFKPRR